MIPPFCSRSGCVAHGQYPRLDWWMRNGHYETMLMGPVPRFRCRICGAGFSAQTFSIDYYAKRHVDYRRLLGLQASSVGIRAAARLEKVDKKTIENKLMRLSHQAIAAQLLCLRRMRLSENLAADGFQSFWVSQYFPNNLHILAGTDSQFVYGYHGTTIRRSGRMSDEQKQRRERLETRFKADPRAVEYSFARIIPLLSRLTWQARRDPIRLFTDEHPSYTRALDNDGATRILITRGMLRRTTVSSKAPRTACNPLFAVNYMDRELRKDEAEHVRETTRYARAAHTSMERLSVYLLHHNFFKRYRIKQPVKDEQTHAGAAGVSKAFFKWMQGWLTTQRVFLTKVPAPSPFLQVWLRTYQTPLAGHRAYLPRYVLD